MNWIPYIEVRSSATRDIIGIVEGAEIFFEYAFNGSGEFEIYCRATPNNLALLQKDHYITIPVNADITEDLIEKNSNMWVIEKIHRSNSKTGGRWITITGREAKQIIDRRIIKGTQILNANKSLVDQVKTKLFDNNLTIDMANVEIGGFESGDDDSGYFYELYTSVGLVESDTINYQGDIGTITVHPDGNYSVFVKPNGAIANASGETITVSINSARKVNGLKFNNNTELADITIADETQVSFENLLDYTEELYLTYGIGSKLRFNRDSKAMFYDIYKGTNRSNRIIFSRGNENLLSSSYTEDWTSYKTGGWVGGEEDDTTKIRKVVILADKKRDIDRREVFIDARDLSSKYEDENGETAYYSNYEGMLVQRGVEKKTSEHNLKSEFSGEIDVTNKRYRFNIDYYLGDIVKIRDDDFGNEILVRISKFIKVQNSDGYKEYFEYERYEEV